MTEVDIYRLPIALTTDIFEPKLFRPHGNVKVATDGGGLVVYFAKGPFNQEIVESLEELESLFLRQIRTDCGGWRELIIFDQSCAMSLETVEALKNYFNQLRRDNIGQHAAALVFLPNVEGRRIIEPLLTKLYADLNIPNRTFDTIPEAIEWLSNTSVTV